MRPRACQPSGSRASGLAFLSLLLLACEAPTAGARGSAGAAGGAGAPSGARPATFVSVACGGEHVCAATSAGEVVCWGYGGRGQLGEGLLTAFTRAPVVVAGLSGATQVAAGGEHTCVLARGGVLCFGRDDYGQLGDGASGLGAQQAEPVAVELPEAATALIAGGTHYGGGHTCAVGVSGAVWCWGANDGGQIGNGDSGANVRAPLPFRVSTLGGRASAVAAGGAHTCALLESGSVSCWGDDNHGQIGDGQSGIGHRVPFPSPVVGLPGRAVAIAAGDDQSCALLASGEAWCWGQGVFGELGIGTPQQPVVVPVRAFPGGTVAALDQGAVHGCVTRATGRVECAGLDDVGELGAGTPGAFSIYGSALPVKVDDAVALSTGSTTTCALRTGGALSCWGDWFGFMPVALSPTPGGQ